MDPKLDEAEVTSIRRPVVLGAIAIAILVALAALFIAGSRLVNSITGGPTPETIASSSLESMRAQNRLNVFAARYVSVTSSRTSRFGFSSERTLILPGDVRYELDLSKLQPGDVTWDASTSTLNVRLPEIEVAGPDVDLAAAREYGAGGVLSTFTNADQSLNQANRAAAVQDLRKQASAKVPMELARQAARAAVERSFAMPLQAAGFGKAKVVARFPTDGSDDPSYLDRSTPYEEAIKEAERRRAAKGR
jgi:hypothetical protein